MLMSICAITSDLGTEAGVSDFRVEDVKKLLPSWLDTFVLASDLDEEVASEPDVGSTVLQADLDEEIA